MSGQAVSKRVLARVGSDVQKYRIERLIGVGGMAAVYAATHRNGNRVAIKFLHEQYAEDAEIRRLFSREAYVANQVEHTGAVNVLDDDEEDGCPFLVMPLLEGESLRRRWEGKKKRLPLAEVAVLIVDTLDVLAAAHAKGIVHRDIKPDNLFVTTIGQVRVLDFGIARRLMSDGSASATGHLMGTPAFMPPEQALGERDTIGPHSDCWAVGATLFTLLSGQFVHRADNANAQLAAAATRRARSLAEAVPALPMTVVEVVDKALAFGVADRWPSAREMGEAMRRAFGEVFGRPLTEIAVQVRAGITAELSPENDSVHENATLSPEREARHEGLHQGDGSTPVEAEPGDAVRGVGVATRGIRGPNQATTTVRGTGTAQDSKPRKRRIWPVVLGAIALLACGAAFATRAHRNREQPIAIPTPSSTSSPALAISSTCNQDAATHYREALISMRKDAWDVADVALQKAVSADPACPEPQLQLAITHYFLTYPIAQVRDHFGRALSLRDVFSERDRLVLNAFYPLIMSEPANRRETAHRFDEAVARFPHDSELLALASSAAVLAAHEEPSTIHRALEFARREVELDPLDTRGWGTQAQALFALGQFEQERIALDKCLEVAPGGTNCLEERSRTFRRLGDCERGVGDARTFVAHGPRNPRAYLSLAQSLASRGADPESVESVLQQMRETGSKEWSDVIYAYNMALLAALHGDFPKAERFLDELAGQAQVSSVLLYHVRMSALLVELLVETGRGQRAASAAQRFLRKKDAAQTSFWPATAFEPLALSALYELSNEQWAKSSGRWEASSQTDLSKRQAWALRWGPVSNVADVARLAWKDRPDDVWAPIPLDQQPVVPYIVREFEGRIALMAGEYEVAAKQLESSLKACFTLEQPFTNTRAHLWLGQAKERLGDVAAACTAYHVVVQRWGSAKPRSVTAEEAKKRIGALGCRF